jgi:hypothetical protein
MKQLPAGTTVRISGHTDSIGTQAANMRLSQRRANAVRQVLVDAGVNPAMLSAKGYGSSQRLANMKGEMRESPSEATQAKHESAGHKTGKHLPDRIANRTRKVLIERANTEPESEIAKLMFRFGLWNLADSGAADLE